MGCTQAEGSLIRNLRIFSQASGHPLREDCGPDTGSGVRRLTPFLWILDSAVCMVLFPGVLCLVFQISSFSFSFHFVISSGLYLFFCLSG